MTNDDAVQMSRRNKHLPARDSAATAVSAEDHTMSETHCPCLHVWSNGTSKHQNITTYCRLFFQHLNNTDLSIIFNVAVFSEH